MAARNCLVLGSGRSGTSMLAGTLAQAGWYAGDDLYPARESNPKGFFEAPAVNNLNELLLAQVLEDDARFANGQRWLCTLPPGVVPRADASARARMRALVARAPWCFKDPRFCYTLPAWRELTRGALRLCVFREPAVTARSILAECSREPYLKGFAIDLDGALEVWDAMYRAVLARPRHEDEWLFLHYEQLLTPDGLARVEQAVGAPIRRDFPEAALKRTRAADPVPRRMAETYEQLCDFAGFVPRGPRVAVRAPALGWQASAPLVSVLLDARRGAAHLPRALDAWRRQDAAAGAFEVLQIGAGAHAGLLEAVAAARGRWALLCDARGAPAPDLLALHAGALRHTGGRRAHCGAVERAELDLEPLLEPPAAEPEPWQCFDLAHALVPREALAAAVTADAPGSGAELALRLLEQGCEVVAQEGPALRLAPERDLDGALARQRERARGFPRLCARHPRALLDPRWQWARAETAAARERFLVERLPRLPRLRASAAALRGLDLAALGTLDPQAAASARELAARLAPALRELAEVARREGLAEGLAELGCADLAELEARLPWPLATSARERLLAWPDYACAPELEALVAHAAGHLARAGGGCLCLRHDDALDLPLDQALERLQQAYARAVAPDVPLEVVVLNEPLEDRELPRLGRAVSAVLRLPSSHRAERAHFLAALGAPAAATVAA